MPLLTLNLSCENVKYPARKHFEKTNIQEGCKNRVGYRGNTTKTLVHQ